MNIIYDFCIVILLGSLVGIFLTLMDRIDEHNLLGKNKSFWAYLAGILCAFFMVISIVKFNFLYPLFFGLCVEWILKNKIDYPSHVFFLFLITFYFGYENKLFFTYWYIIVIILGVRLISSVWLKNLINKNTKFYRYFYLSYAEKIVGGLIVSLLLNEYLFITFIISFAFFSLQTKLQAEKIKIIITSKIR